MNRYHIGLGVTDSNKVHIFLPLHYIAHNFPCTLSAWRDTTYELARNFPDCFFYISYKLGGNHYSHSLLCWRNNIYNISDRRFR